MLNSASVSSARWVSCSSRLSSQPCGRLGLFGVLSIIRLRSEELAQHEVAYYFAALALGLLGGLRGALQVDQLGAVQGQGQRAFPIGFLRQQHALDVGMLNDPNLRLCGIFDNLL